MEMSKKEKSVSELFEEISRDAKPIFEQIKKQFSRYDDLSEEYIAQASTHLSIVIQLFLSAAIEAFAMRDESEINTVINSLLGYMGTFLPDDSIEEEDYLKEANQILDLWMGRQGGEA